MRRSRPPMRAADDFDEDDDRTDHAAICDDARPRLSAGLQGTDGVVDTEQRLSGAAQDKVWT